jgi:CRP-like cAMP-binding protein|nr:cyclic nucleotide-binding domain-containing protein [Thiomonas sp.]
MESLPITPKDRENLAQFLGNLVDTSILLRREVHDFLDYCDLMAPKKGEIIADIGQVGEALFFVLEGHGCLMAQMPESEMEIGKIESGEMLGEMSFFDRKPREVRLRAGADTRLLRISRAMYQRLRLERPLLAVLLLEAAIISLDHLYRRTSTDMTQLNRYIHRTGR